MSFLELQIISINIETISLSKGNALDSLCCEQKYDNICVQEIFRGTDQHQQNVPTMCLHAKKHHKQYGSTIFKLFNNEQTNSINIED